MMPAWSCPHAAGSEAAQGPETPSGPRPQAPVLAQMSSASLHPVIPPEPELLLCHIYLFRV